MEGFVAFVRKDVNNLCNTSEFNTIIPFGGQADLFSAIGYRLWNLGVHPLKISASGGHP
jgi:hypothetical protein